MCTHAKTDYIIVRVRDPVESSVDYGNTTVTKHAPKKKKKGGGGGRIFFSVTLRSHGP